MKKFLFTLFLALPAMAIAKPSFEWKQSSGSGILCYELDGQGKILHNGAPVSSGLCEKFSPTIISWGTSRGGVTKCYQYTQDGKILNKGGPIHEAFCEKMNPSVFKKDHWGKCYQHAPDGRILNSNQPVSVEFCD